MSILALTAGEPAGIGPELCVQVAQRTWPVPVVAVADAELLRQRKRLGPLTKDQEEAIELTLALQILIQS